MTISDREPVEGPLAGSWPAWRASIASDGHARHRTAADQDDDLRFRCESRPGAGALALLYCMEDGVRAARQRDARITAGEYRQEDLETADL